jgi:hypothetical protein
MPRTERQLKLSTSRKHSLTQHPYPRMVNRSKIIESA